MTKSIIREQREEPSAEHRRRAPKLAEPKPDETEPRPLARAPSPPHDDVFALYVEYL